MKQGHANLPLHGGRAPSWLFKRMKVMAGSVAEIMVMELGPDGFLKRIADPFWFQCLGCVLGFDWHSSGLTTTTCGALKEGIRGREHDLGLFICGGKGAASRKTPQQILDFSERAGTPGDDLVYASRLSAKVDSSALQDGFQVYHHVFFFTKTGHWSVVQQGMNEATGWARRYHWLQDPRISFTCEPHAAVLSDGRSRVRNFVAREAGDCRIRTAEVSRLAPDKVLAELKKICDNDVVLDLPGRHGIHDGQDINPSRLKNIFVSTYEKQAEDFEQLLGTPGVGAKSIRALSLVGQLLYGAQPSFRDPARFSFAHGGKDGIPYPVDRPNYDRTIAILEQAIRQARVGRQDKFKAFKRMARWLDRQNTEAQTPQI